MLRLHRAFLVVGSTLCLSLAWGTQPCLANVRLPRIFGNQMVLQRELPVRVCGSADPGEKVTVSIGKSEASSTADAHGKWNVELPALSGGDPVEVIVQGKNTITLRDVLVGEVWVCSGQSNMQWPVQASTRGKKEVQEAKYPQIRLFTVPMRPAGEPADDVDAYWKACTPESIPQFSAVAYFFGRELHQKLGVPIGLINTSWGGTRIEPWTPPAGFRSVPALASFFTYIEEVDSSYRKAALAGVNTAHPFASNLQPTGLYNGMIHPLVPFAMRGAIWYQGESNNGEGMRYYEKMKALIAGWRSAWNEGDFPFLFVQLAPFNYGKAAATSLPQIWEAQTATLAVPNTGMAVTNDIGNPTDIHPKNKQDTGKRLALWALAKTYGKEGLVYSGPLFKSMSIDGSTIRLQFDHIGGGLASRDGKPLTWFTIAGDNKKFVAADAKIDGDSIVVSSPNVAKPVAVRFGWDQVAEPNLSNKEGLPASAFRTDRW